MKKAKKILPERKGKPLSVMLRGSSRLATLLDIFRAFREIGSLL